MLDSHLRLDRVVVMTIIPIHKHQSQQARTVSCDCVLLPPNGRGGLKGYTHHDILSIRDPSLHAPAAIGLGPTDEKTIQTRYSHGQLSWVEYHEREYLNGRLGWGRYHDRPDKHSRFG